MAADVVLQGYYMYKLTHLISYACSAWASLTKGAWSCYLCLYRPFSHSQAHALSLQRPGTRCVRVVVLKVMLPCNITNVFTFQQT